MCTSEMFNLWQRRLGHLNEQYMQQLKIMLDNLKISKSANFHCKVCFMVKQERKPFNGQRTRATKPLEIIHIDVFGPIISKLTFDNKRYILTFFGRLYTLYYCIYIY